MLESSLTDLYRGTVMAFPHTTKRQHIADQVSVTIERWIPYLGMKTLFIKGLAKNEEREYHPVIVLKNINYHKEARGGLLALTTEGQEYYLEKPSIKETDVLVRCQCEDYKWRFAHTNDVSESSYGSKRKKYEAKLRPGSSNPLEMEGMCKHLIQMIRILQKEGIL